MTTLVPVPNDGRGFAEFNALVASQNRFREIEFDRDQDEVAGWRNHDDCRWGDRLGRV
jgi:hypothetical protein